MTIATDEIFGPVQSILKWSSVEEVCPVLTAPLGGAHESIQLPLERVFCWVADYTNAA